MATVEGGRAPAPNSPARWGTRRSQAKVHPTSPGGVDARAEERDRGGVRMEMEGGGRGTDKRTASSPLPEREDRKGGGRKA